jgi:hypothetical protein
LEIIAANLAGTDFVGKLARESLEKGLAASPQTFDSGWFSDWVIFERAEQHPACRDRPEVSLSDRGARLIGLRSQ